MADNFQYFNPTAGMIGGLVQGLTQGKVAQQERARQDEELKLKKDALKVEQKYKESLLVLKGEEAVQKHEFSKIIADVLNAYTGGGQGLPTIPGAEAVPPPTAQGAPAPPAGFPSAPGAPNFMGPGSVGFGRGMAPVAPPPAPAPQQQAAPAGAPPQGQRPNLPFEPVIDSTGKITLRPKVESWAEQKWQDPETGIVYSQFIDKKTRQPVPGLEPTIIEMPTPQAVRVKDPDGTERTVFVNPHGGRPRLNGVGGGGTPRPGGGPGIVTAPGPADTPMSAPDVQNWTNEKGEFPPIGTTPAQAVFQGYNLNQKALTSENAGKLTMLMQGRKDIEEVMTMLFPGGEWKGDRYEGGKYQKGIAVGASMNLPGSRIQMVQSRIENALEAKLRSETGAQANEDELKGMIRRFSPGWRDGAASAKDKLERLNEFLKYATVTVDPSGKYIVKYPAGRFNPFTGEKTSGKPPLSTFKGKK